MNASTQRTCALCQQTRPLRLSHIVPEFLYSPLYEENHSINTYGHKGRAKAGFMRKGEREDLLCDECERRFSVYEGWASDFYKGALAAFADTTRTEIRFGKTLNFTRIDEAGQQTTSPVPRILHIEGFDYVKMKLFLLSLLWRMGVSRLHFFGEISLGIHEKRIRNMLLNNEPGKAEVYACQLRLIQLDGRLITDCQIQPKQYDHLGKKRCKFFSSGFRFDFTVNNHPPDPESLELFCVKPSPEYNCWVDSILTHPDLREDLVRLGRNMNWVGETRNTA